MKDFTLSCTIPSTTYIGKSNISNFGVFANEDFKKGDIIYKNSAIIVKNDDIPDIFYLQTSEERFILNKNHHLVPYGDNNTSLLYNFDTFSNHSCDPNTIYPLIDKDPCNYQCIAFKDIRAGEELTCNYNLMPYNDHSPFSCNCGYSECYGKIGGLYSLNNQAQKEILEKYDLGNFSNHVNY